MCVDRLVYDVKCTFYSEHVLDELKHSTAKQPKHLTQEAPNQSVSSSAKASLACATLTAYQWSMSMSMFLCPFSSIIKISS